MESNALINSGKRIKLEQLYRSREINDKSIICVYDAEGKFLARGSWFEDRILQYSEEWGEATKSGTGRSLMFRMA